MFTLTFQFNSLFVKNNEIKKIREILRDFSMMEAIL